MREWLVVGILDLEEVLAMRTKVCMRENELPLIAFRYSRLGFRSGAASGWRCMGRGVWWDGRRRGYRMHIAVLREVALEVGCIDADMRYMRRSATE